MKTWKEFLNEGTKQENHYSDTVLGILISKFGWRKYDSKTIEKAFKGVSGGEVNPSGVTKVVAKFDSIRSRYLEADLGFRTIFDIDGRNLINATNKDFLSFAKRFDKGVATAMKKFINESVSIKDIESALKRKPKLDLFLDTITGKTMVTNVSVKGDVISGTDSKTSKTISFSANAVTRMVESLDEAKEYARKDVVAVFSNSSYVDKNTNVEKEYGDEIDAALIALNKNDMDTFYAIVGAESDKQKKDVKGLLK